MFITYFAMIMQMMPGILDLIIKIENIVGQGQGPAKAAMLVNMVTAVANSDPAMAEAAKKYDLEGAVKGIATSVVNGLNTTGTFKSGSIHKQTQK